MLNSRCKVLSKINRSITQLAHFGVLSTIPLLKNILFIILNPQITDHYPSKLCYLIDWVIFQVDIYKKEMQNSINYYYFCYSISVQIKFKIIISHKGYPLFLRRVNWYIWDGLKLRVERKINRLSYFENLFVYRLKVLKSNL